MKCRIGLLLLGMYTILPLSVTAQEDTADAARIFDQLDKNSDGRVAPDEIDEQQRQFFARVLQRGDRDEDRQLTREEFAAGVADRENSLLAADNQIVRGSGDRASLFERLDANQDGCLSKEELPPALQNRFRRNFDGPDGVRIGHRRHVAQIFEQLDTNKDGKLTPNEISQDAPRGLARMFERTGTDTLTPADLAKRRRPDHTGPRGERGGRLTIERFDGMDTNGDGKLTADEVPQQVKSRFEHALQRLDRDDDGTISRKEFLSASQQPGPRADGPRRGGRPAGPHFLRLLDTDHNGKLSAAELNAAAERLQELDRDNDGELSFRELLAAPSGRDNRDRRRGRPRRPDLDTNNRSLFKPFRPK